ncbi:IS3 family transposase [Photobacterium sp. TLY01]|uniref:IS3 family transposase n=1 Tax=Photobacterium sp. TLY01 TaxID=2907534 RepID=UPI001F3C81F1|nr:IS3 family transposase [Photobacterium sp. TLY01]UIP29871.1 IS3 family transposase [Photobacterium sp. TLY01]
MAPFPGGGTAQKYRFIKHHQASLPVRQLCARLQVSRSGYYDWLKRQPSQRRQQDDALLLDIHRIHAASKSRYGSPKVHRALRQEGIRVGVKRVARLMREAGLKARVECVYRRMHKRRAELKVLPNYRLEESKPTGPNQQWSSDVTYIRLGRRHVFLAVIVDLWSRKIVGWALDDKLNARLSTTALSRALKQRKPRPGLLLHTDRGIEFRALMMQRWLTHYGIRHSMNRPGKCTDNAEVESFFKTLKAELIHASNFGSLESLRKQVDYYIRYFYNRVRLHSSLDYVSPIQYEKAA